MRGRQGAQLQHKTLKMEGIYRDSSVVECLLDVYEATTKKKKEENK